MIYGIIGGMSKGKTAVMTHFLKKAHDNKRLVYSNYHLNFRHTKVTEEMLYEYAHSGVEFGNLTIGLDELYLYLDCRLSSKRSNRVYSYFALQTSKRDVDLYYTAQNFHSVDKRIRDNTHVIMESYPVLIKDGKMTPRDTTKQRLLPKKDIEYFYFLVVCMERVSFGFKTGVKRTYKLIKGNDVFNLYDTREIIKFNKNEDKKH